MSSIHLTGVEGKNADPGLAERCLDLLPEVRAELVGLRGEVHGLREEIRALRGEREESAMIDVPTSAHIAGVSERTMRTLIHAGEVPSAKIGRRRLVPRAAFRAWLDRQVEHG